MHVHFLFAFCSPWLPPQRPPIDMPDMPYYLFLNLLQGDTLEFFSLDLWGFPPGLKSWWSFLMRVQLNCMDFAHCVSAFHGRHVRALEKSIAGGSVLAWMFYFLAHIQSGGYWFYMFRLYTKYYPFEPLYFKPAVFIYSLHYFLLVWARDIYRASNWSLDTTVYCACR